MLDMSQISKRYWDIKFTNGLVLSVEPPTLKTLRKITELTNDNDSIVKNLCVALSMALSKNKQTRKITAEFLEENMDMDDIQLVLTDYFEWVKGVKNSPN